MPLLASWSDWSRALEAAPLGGISTSGNRRKKLFSTSRIADDVNKFHLKRRYFESNYAVSLSVYHWLIQTQNSLRRIEN